MSEQKYTIPVSPRRRVFIEGPWPLTTVEWQRMITILETFRPGLVESGVTATPTIDIETACEVMHDAYEQAAVGAGWETQEASRKPWADVPEANKDTMRAAVSALLQYVQESK